MFLHADDEFVYLLVLLLILYVKELKYYEIWEEMVPNIWFLCNMWGYSLLIEVALFQVVKAFG